MSLFVMTLKGKITLNSRVAANESQFLSALLVAVPVLLGLIRSADCSCSSYKM